MKKILMILFPVLAFVGGSAAGAMLKGGSDPAEGAEMAAPAEGEPEEGTEHAEEAPVSEDHSVGTADAGGHGEAETEGGSTTIGWFGFPNQFFVPVVRNGRTDFIMILTLSLQTTPGTETAIAAQEHRLRDALLRRLLIEANTGGFDGNFTADAQQRILRENLLQAAQDIGGADVQEVLIEAIVRQEA